MPNGSLLDLVFISINDLSVSISDFSMISLDKYHPPLLLDFQLMLDYSHLLSTPCRLYGRGDYLLLYNTLLNFDRLCLFSENAVDSTVLNLTVIVSDAINKAMPFAKYRNSSFPYWFSSTMKYYIKNRNQYFRRYKKSKSAEHYASFSHYRKLVKIALNTDRLRWLKSVDSDLKTQPKQF
jgi:hypothetical protein